MVRGSMAGGTIAVSTIFRGRTHAYRHAVGHLRPSRRSPATLSSFHQGRAPRNKGQRYPADPPTVEGVIAVMRAAGSDSDAVRLRGLIAVLWRAALRISQALALNESDLDLQRGAILIRHGKGGKAARSEWIAGPGNSWTRGSRSGLRCRSERCSACCAVRPWAPAGVRSQLDHAAARAGVRRRFAPHQPRHARAVEMSREGVPLLVIERQLGHADLAITSAWDAQRSAEAMSNLSGTFPGA